MNDNKNNNNGAAPPLPPPLSAAAKAKRAARAKKEKTAAATAGRAPAAIRNTPITVSHDSNKPAERFTYVFGPQEKAVHDYLRCVFQPNQYAARVPASRGSFELYTKLWRTQESGSIVAGVDGNAVLGLCAANWVESGNNTGLPLLGCQILGYTNQGTASFASSDQTLGYAGFPGLGFTVGAGWQGQILDTPSDTPLDPQTRIRLVAMELRVHSVMAAVTSKGELMLCGTVNPVAGVRSGSLNGAAWDDIVKTNDGVMTRAIRGLPSWKSGEVMSIVAMPAEDQAFEMCEVPATGVSSPSYPGGPLFPAFNIGLLARSMTPGDKINYEVTYVWETELAKSNTAEGSKGSKAAVVPASTMNIAMSAARPLAAHNQLQGVHALPWIETMAKTNPNALVALEKHPVMANLKDGPRTRPGVLYQEPETGFWGKLWSGAKQLHNSVTDTGLLAKIPYIGLPLQAAASALSSLFD